MFVVDGDEPIRQLLDDVLGDEGYHVTTAACGDAALTRYHHQGQPDLLLLDDHLPGMDPVAFLEAYRRLCGPPAPVVVLSTWGATAARLRAAGADAVVAMPFELDDLLTVVGQYAR